MIVARGDAHLGSVEPFVEHAQLHAQAEDARPQLQFEGVLRPYNQVGVETLGLGGDDQTHAVVLFQKLEGHVAGDEVGLRCSRHAYPLLPGRGEYVQFVGAAGGCWVVIAGERPVLAELRVDLGLCRGKDQTAQGNDNDFRNLHTLFPGRFSVAFVKIPVFIITENSL